MPRDSCPICDVPHPEPFLFRPSVPVHQNLLFTTAAAARSIQRGDLDMRVCRNCGFVFNAAFQPALTDYGPQYENSQEYSPAFSAHLNDRVEHLVVERGVRNGYVVEVGCGKGVFLGKLLAHPANQSKGIGLDPAYLGPTETMEGRLQFRTSFYGPGTAIRADAVICRHVIEHIADPMDLLRTIRAATQDDRVRVFFETPCAEWILRDAVPWDFFYEHCSLFTTHSLGLALTRAGFAVSSSEHVFDGQYLWAEGVTGPGQWQPPIAETARLAKTFSARERARIESWERCLDEWCAHGPIVVWGAGAKGVTFCNLVDRDGRRVMGVVDVNPAKQGRFLAGTGHPIVAPAGALASKTAIVLNPAYVKEVAAILRELGSCANVIDLSAWEESHATHD